MATISSFKIPKINNEPNQHYGKSSAEREKLSSALEAFKAQSPLNVPIVIGGQQIKGSSTKAQVDPSSHSTVVANYSYAGAEEVNVAIDKALKAKESWEMLPFADRAAIFLKAADLISGKYRYELMAATMIGQGKNAWQAEIDAAAELIDFLRFNVQYAEEIYASQPLHNSPGIWNRVEYRPLEGFVYAITPFNFTAIGGNLAVAPALMGNVVIWKPSDYAIASNYLFYSILIEAGLPPNVIQFVPGDPVAVTETVLNHKQFAALHYTGSTAIFRKLYGKIAQGVVDEKYLGYPRIVGETGGKNFHLIHPSADIPNAVANTVRGAFEYSGQKCSATSRVYVPKSVWGEFKPALIKATEALKVGPSTEWGTFIGPVIHQGSFDRVSEAIDSYKSDSALTLLAGGTHDSSKGYFIHPTVFETSSPTHDIMIRELFGPVLGVYVYDDTNLTASFKAVCNLIDNTGSYALTGSIFAKEREAVRYAEDALRNAAGNFYVNCKSTGAVVGQQSFGGARASGTNDKAGSANLLTRFVSARSIKEDFIGSEAVNYPSNEE